MTEPLFCVTCKLWADVPPGGDCPTCRGRLTPGVLLDLSGAEYPGGGDVLHPTSYGLANRRHRGRRRALSGRFTSAELN